jgi:hypothetical protein
VATILVHYRFTVDSPVDSKTSFCLSNKALSRKQAVVMFVLIAVQGVEFMASDMLRSAKHIKPYAT